MSGGSGARVRLVVLLILLLAAVGLFCYDRYVLLPKSQKIVADLEELSLASVDVGTHDAAKKVLGTEAIKTTAVEGTAFTIEEYRLPRILPFTADAKLWVAYKESRVYKVSHRTELTPNMVAPQFEKREVPEDNPLRIGGAGGGGGGGQSGRRRSGGEEGDQGATEGNTDGAQTDATETEKKDDGQQENTEGQQEEKKDDGQGDAGEEKKDDGGDTQEEKKDDGDGEGGGDGSGGTEGDGERAGDGG